MVIHLPRNKGIHGKNLPLKNENFFENPNSHKQNFMLGLIFSDGCIYIGDYSYILVFGNSSRYVVDLFAETFNKNISFKPAEKIGETVITRPDGTKHTIKANKGRYTVTISSYRIVRDLLRLGIDFNKTYSHNISLFEKSDSMFMSSLLRGIFDGDGCISRYIANTTKYYNGTEYRYSFPEATFTATSNWSDIVCRKIGDLYEKFIPLRHSEIVRNENSNCWIYKKKGNNNLQKIYNFLYKDCGDLKMPEKETIFREYLNEIKTIRRGK
jgi:hypothetical protein